MFHVKRSHEHFHSQNEWLSSYWHFSFDHYYDPHNIHWGALRVFNDDAIQPNSGFPMHPHKDMEIVTYVLSGALSHEDSLGNKGIIHAGEVQVMSAGTGIVHSEYNASKEKEVHLIQMWVLPEKRSLKPRWEQKAFLEKARTNRLLGVANENGKDGALRVHQDSKLFVCHLEKGKKVTHETEHARKLYLFVGSGDLEVRAHKMHAVPDKKGLVLHTRDAVRVEGEELLELEALEGTDFLFWDCVNV